MILQILLLLALSFRVEPVQSNHIFNCNNGDITFLSNASLESIEAKSHQLRGAVDITLRTFVFTVNTNSFEGFNSSLQKEHFDENYLETDKYPIAKFDGKLIEEIDLSKEGNYEIRAKGIFEIHGVKQERIIKGNIEVKAASIHISSHFTVLLDDHDIKIPRVVYQKISPEIQVTIDAELKPYNAK